MLALKMFGGNSWKDLKAVVRGWKVNSYGLLRCGGRRRDVEMKMMVNIETVMGGNGNIGYQCIRSVY